MIAANAVLHLVGFLSLLLMFLCQAMVVLNSESNMNLRSACSFS